jgi:D-alanine-D-alanine ligase
VRALLLHDALGPDARPDERDVRAQIEAVGAALAGLGFESTLQPVDLDLGRVAREIEAARPDLVVNLVESLAGEGRLIHLVPCLLDALGVAYTGCPGEALLLTTHKVLAKRWLVSHGLPTPGWYEADPTGRTAVREAGRYLVKSIWEDASLGLDDAAVVELRAGDDVTALLHGRAASLGGAAFAERYVEGREFNLALLEGPEGTWGLPPSEILFDTFPPGKPRIVGYAAKWDPDAFEFRATPRRLRFPEEDGKLLDELERLALGCWELFGLAGYARVDFRVDEEGRPWILEVNANPCLSPDAGFAAAAAEAGLSPRDVVERLVAAARRRTPRAPS